MQKTKWREVIDNILQGSEIRLNAAVNPIEPGVVSLGNEEQELLSNLILLALPSPSEHVH